MVGVVRDVKQSSWSGKPANEFYIPFQQDAGFLSGAHPWVTYMTLVVRTAGDPLSMAGAVQRTIWSLNKDVPISDVRSMEQVIARALWQAHFQGLIVGLFAAFAMLLAAIGIYGVMTYSVTRRTQEIGIRVALGARPSSVIWLILKQAAVLVAAGLILGLSAAFALARFVAKLLYGISPADPVTFVVVPLALAAIALVASYLPARRATKVDPVIALRAG